MQRAERETAYQEPSGPDTSPICAQRHLGQAEPGSLAPWPSLSDAC